jgi:hypothetical protein
MILECPTSLNEDFVVLSKHRKSRVLVVVAIEGDMVFVDTVRDMLAGRNDLARRMDAAQVVDLRERVLVSPKMGTWGHQGCAPTVALLLPQEAS